MKIKSVQAFILHVPVTGSQIADSTHSITHWGVVGVQIDTDNGLTGYGFTGTHAHLPSDQLITCCIETCHAPLLIGEDAGDIHRLWQKLAHHPALQWVGRAGITTLSHAAMDLALWDLKAKAAEQPLWKLLGGWCATRCGPTTPTSAGSASPTTCGWPGRSGLLPRASPASRTRLAPRLSATCGDSPPCASTTPTAAA